MGRIQELGLVKIDWKRVMYREACFYGCLFYVCAGNVFGFLRGVVRGAI